MSMSFTPSREQVESLLAGLDSISRGLDEVRAVLSESANAQQTPGRARDSIRQIVLFKLKELDPLTTDNSLEQLWIKALNNLKKVGKVTETQNLHLINIPEKDEIHKTITSIKNNLDSTDVVKSMLLHLLQLSKYSRAREMIKKP